MLSAIAVINEAVDRGDTADTLQALLVDAAKLSGVHPGNAQLYQTLLAAEKSSKAQVPSAGPNHSDFSSVGTSRFGLELRAKGVSPTWKEFYPPQNDGKSSPYPLQCSGFKRQLYDGLRWNKGKVGIVGYTNWTDR